MNVVPVGMLGPGAGFAGLRPEHLRVTPVSGATLAGKVVHSDALGHEVIVHVAIGDEVLLARSTRDGAPALHSDTGLTYNDADVYRFGADGRAL